MYNNIIGVERRRWNTYSVTPNVSLSFAAKETIDMLNRCEIHYALIPHVDPYPTAIDKTSS